MTHFLFQVNIILLHPEVKHKTKSSSLFRLFIKSGFNPNLVDSPDTNYWLSTIHQSLVTSHESLVTRHYLLVNILKSLVTTLYFLQVLSLVHSGGIIFFLFKNFQFVQLLFKRQNYLNLIMLFLFLMFSFSVVFLFVTFFYFFLTVWLLNAILCIFHAVCMLSVYHFIRMPCIPCCLYALFSVCHVFCIPCFLYAMFSL